MDDSDDSDSSASGWGDWLQKTASTVIGGYVGKDTNTDYQLKKQQLTQLGQLGYYTEGQTTRAQAQSMNGTILLIGLAVVAVMLLKD